MTPRTDPPPVDRGETAIGSAVAASLALAALGASTGRAALLGAGGMGVATAACVLVVDGRLP